MQFSWLTVALAIAVTLASPAFQGDKIDLKVKSQSAQDLRLSGDIPGLPSGSVRYITYDQLRHLPQTSFHVTDDYNFHGHPTDITGIPLNDLLRTLNIPDKDTLVAAICDDGYEAHYTSDYRHAHSPILVLQLNGKSLAQNARTSDDGIYGPYLISHAAFKPRYHVLAHAEEAQIPNGLLELRFLKEGPVFDSIRPHGKFADDSAQMQGYTIAQQNCFRCHNEGAYGGSKSGRSWSALAKIAAADPAGFAAYIKDPQSQDPSAVMPANPEYDGPTLHALTAYFQTFAPAPGSTPQHAKDHQ
jgi:hypothetical protein